MPVNCLVKMFCILLCPVLLVAVQTLTIDSQLGTSIEDCFDRFAIGEQLPRDAIYRNVSELTSRECEVLCKQDKQCQTYEYGVGAKGNATCNLSSISEKEIKDKNLIFRHPDYDIYVRRFQCEQSPPKPLQTQFDDPGDSSGPTHRPIFRPDDDDPRRPVEDYINDSRPFESIRPDLIKPIPPYRPYHQNYIDNDRPDDYTNQKPTLDAPPSYGDHRPQSIPFKPDNEPYKPSRPSHSNRPDSVDIFQLQDPYRPTRPLDPGFWRPDPYHPPHLEDDLPDLYGQKPNRPYKPHDDPYGLEKPVYHYIVRPNRKPKPPEEEGYIKPYSDNRPAGPPNYNQPSNDYPSRPIEKPSYSYNSQYASNYGQDNSIYVEIYDPPRPYKPPQKPDNDRPSYGSQGSYGQNYGYDDQSNYGYGSSHQSQSSQHYGQGTITEIHNHNRPQDLGGYNQNSEYGSMSTNYGSQNSGYGSPDNKPNVTKRPLYQTNQGSYGSNQASYGSSQNEGSHSNQSLIGINGASYASQSHSQGGYSSQTTQKPQKPSYGGNQGLYGSNGNSYGSDVNQGSNKPSFTEYIQHHGSHYSSHESNSQSYGVSYGTNGSIKPSYSEKPLNDRPLYDSDPHYYGSNRPYGNDMPFYGNNRPLYGNDLPSYNRPSYGNYRPSSIENRPIYQYDRPIDIDRPSYGNERPSIDKDRPSYGNNRPLYGGSSYDINHRPSYDINRPDPPSQDNGPSLSNQGSSGYGSQSTALDVKPSYNPKPKPNQTNYNQERPDIKPVYEFDNDKPNNVPSYIVRPGGEVVTSRPVTVGDYGTGYGRDPGLRISFKACFRRVLAGRRALRSFVKKVVDCERLEDCRRECATERRFPCESFNYRLDPSFRGKGLCELMTKPIEAFDLRQDFVEDKDYDFYEVDRNSLEPNCPETLRGPGMLHSGFLSSKPDRLPGYQNQWSDRIDHHDIRYRDYHHYYEDRRRNHRRRYEDRFYVPYQIDVGRSNEADFENWGTYGGSYGGYDTYYKDRNDYHKSVNHWRISNHIDRPVGVKPGYNTDFDYYSLGKDKFFNNHRYGYGAWKRDKLNISGSLSGFDYGESNYYKPKPQYYEPVERDEDLSLKDCSSRRRPGMSLGSGAIRRSLLAWTVVECEAACFGEREFKCVSYSYRYSSSRGTDNCFLSERPYRGLELSADSGSDVYAMPQNQGCSTISHRPWVESECFWHVRTGAAVSGQAVRAALTVAGLGACEAECIRAYAFFCRGFSFRFDDPAIGDNLENCILTSSPPTSLETNHGLHPTAGHELYARGNYGRGCEPALYDDVHYREKQCYLQYDNAAKLVGTAVRGQARVEDEQACAEICTGAPFRCLSFSFRNSAPPNVDNCLLSEIRLFDLQRGVDYEHSSDDWLFAFDLFNGQCWKKIHGKAEDHHTPDLPRPLTGPSGEAYPGSVPSGSGSSGGPVDSGPAYPGSAETPLTSGSGPPSAPGFKPGYSNLEKPSYTAPSAPETSAPGYKPDYPETGGYLPRPDFKPGFIPSESTGPSYDSFKPGFNRLQPSGPGYNGFKPGYSPDYLPSSGSKPFRPGYLPEPDYKPGYPGDLPYRPVDRSQPEIPERPAFNGNREETESITVSWRHYTVSGFPCRAGTVCAQNQVAGHWACEPEGGEVGSWDYCCAPTHRCGYSEGFHKPWCYVGPAEDQWRPCSEKYYPYHQHNIPHPSLVQGQREDHRYPGRPRPSRPNYIPDREDRPLGPYLSVADRKYWDDLYRDGPQAYYDKYGNPLPGYSRVPMSERPHIRYKHNYPRPGTGTWIPVNPSQEDPLVSGGLGVPRYWPVAYLHKGPPPNMTYFTYNETKTTTEKYLQTPSTPKEQPSPEFNRFTERPKDIVEARSHRDEKTRTIPEEDLFKLDLDKTTTTTKKPEPKESNPKVEIDNNKVNKSDVETIDLEKMKTDKESENLKGIDDKLDDFTGPIEVLDLVDEKKGEKMSDLKTLEAEERQIEAIGRLLASRRGSKLVLQKRSQKDLEAKSIAIDQDALDFNFGNRFPSTDRRGIVQKVSKDEIERERNVDKSLEVSETTFVRPPRVLSTTENVRRAIVNGKVFYDATIREQRDLYSNSTRKAKSHRQLDDYRAPSVLASNYYGKKKVLKTRNVNPVRRVRRVYRKRYNPDEVRRRLLERERSIKDSNDSLRKL